MIELGKKNEIFGLDLLKPIKIFYNRPTKLPALSQDQRLICGYNQGLGERIIVCETLEDAQCLYDAYERGGAVDIKWYLGEDVGFVGSV